MDAPEPRLEPHGGALTMAMLYLEQGAKVPLHLGRLGLEGSESILHGVPRVSWYAQHGSRRCTNSFELCRHWRRAWCSAADRVPGGLRRRVFLAASVHHRFCVGSHGGKPAERNCFSTVCVTQHDNNNNSVCERNRGATFYLLSSVHEFDAGRKGLVKGARRPM